MMRCPEICVNTIQEFRDGLLAQCQSLDQLVPWHLPCSLSFWQHYCLQCTNTLAQRFSSAQDLMENYYNWLD